MRTASETTMDEQVVEWAPFRLAPGTDETAFLDASDALQRDFLAPQPGFRRRELLRAPDGHWVDLIVWRDEETAMAAMRAAEASPICHAYLHFMEGGDTMTAGADVLHFHRVRAY